MSKTVKGSLLLKAKNKEEKTRGKKTDKKKYNFFLNGRRMKQNRTGQLKRKKKLNIIKIQEFAELKSA